jgi:uncharacterized protein
MKRTASIFVIGSLLVSFHATAQETAEKRTLCDAGDLAERNAILAGGADINAPCCEGCDSPLFMFLGDYEFTKLLLERGASVKTRNVLGYTPLMALANLPLNDENQNYEIMKLMIAKGADVNAVDSIGMTALMCAKSGDTRIIGLLADKGANVNARDKGGRSVLMHCIANADAVRLLIAKGANVNAEDASGGTALHDAASGGHLESARMLVAGGARIEAPCEYVYMFPESLGPGVLKKATPLHLAALNDDIEMVKLLVERGANVNNKTEDGSTVLSLTSDEGVKSYLRGKGAR